MNRFLKTSTPALLALAFLALVTPSCGGGSAVDAGRGLALLSFHQGAVDNMVLNARLAFEFSEDVDPATIHNASMQIREGPSFGASVPGVFVIEANTVYFEPRLAGLCDHSDSGLKPATQYRVQVIGFPEEFAVRNTAGQALDATQTYEFQTREDTDPNKYDDQIPGVGPTVTQATPADGSEAVAVGDRNRIVLEISENLNPCSVNDASVRLYMYETGGLGIFAPAPNTKNSGFSSDGTDTGATSDQAPLDPYSWGAIGSVSLQPNPQKILTDIELVQSMAGTHITVTPTSGKFPENALLVRELTADIIDYGNQLMTPFACTFTTENLPGLSSTYVVENEGETPWDADLSSAEINTARSPSLVRGFMLFAGDGDNGGSEALPSLPETPASGCTVDRQANSGAQNDFDPAADIVFDTGASDNTCPNSTDGSTAVIWEFRSFHIRSGVTVRIIGNNPAVILVLGDILIDAGGRLSARSDNTGGSPRGIGRKGFDWFYNSTAGPIAGGTGVAGAGDGGQTAKHMVKVAGDAYSAFGSIDGRDVLNVEGAGQGGVGHWSVYPGPSSGSAQGGGGGGHGDAGTDGPNALGPNHTLQATARGAGGAEYPTGPDADRMLTPSAGGGGGAGGNDQWSASYTSYSVGGGSGGAGGGFVDLTSSGDIVILGTIDASGCRGGNSGAPYTGTDKSSGGGGAGGGIRLLTPNEIILSASTVITAAGGAGGISTTAAVGQNDGGPGANGRIVMGDGDSVITGLAGATLVMPSEGDKGFYRGLFDASRFKGGGLTPAAVSHVFACGAFNPTYVEPVQGDFVAGTPVNTTLGAGRTAILIEAQGFDMKPDATPDAVGTGWHTIGHLTDSGVDTLPTWMPGQPSPAQLPAGLPGDNVGSGITSLNGREFIQLRVTIYLSSSVGPFDAGPYLDRWTIRFDHDQ